MSWAPPLLLSLPFKQSLMNDNKPEKSLFPGVQILVSPKIIKRVNYKNVWPRQDLRLSALMDTELLKTNAQEIGFLDSLGSGILEMEAKISR